MVRLGEIMELGIIAAAFFGFVFGLIAAGAALGFLAVLYIGRPKLFAELLACLEYEATLLTKTAAGLAIAFLVPLVAGLSYALSGTQYLVDLFGVLGQFFWGWVAAAFLLGIILACLLRHSTHELLCTASFKSGRG